MQVIMKTNFNAKLIFFIILSFSISVNLQADNKSKVEDSRKLELNIPMKDGILLATDVYLPKTNSPVSTVLIRTPYNKDGVKNAVEKFLKNNIAVVAQDCRGRDKSEGQFYPFLNEREDGLTTLNWIKQQDWSNGKVGGWGGSYVGYTQWAISDSLDVFAPNMTGANIYELLYSDGLLSLQTAFTWGFAVSGKKINENYLNNLAKANYILPLSTADDSVSSDVKFINDWIEHENYDDYWSQMDHSGITRSPLISVAGWYDIFLKQQINDFQLLLENGSPNSRLIIGPWCHGTPGVKNDYGGKRNTGNQGEIMDNFLIKYLSNESQQLIERPFHDSKYNLFIMERNEYFGSDTWPPKKSKLTSFYIGKNNSLSTNIHSETGILQYIYSPEDPYPSFGGTALGANVGPSEQNKNRSRKDQLVFETEILKAPLTLLGDLSAELYVSSDAECSDFIVCVQDVFPDDNIINIQEGGKRIRFPDSEILKTQISVWSTGYELKEGHKLRVVITSSWFPRYNRSLNTCVPAFSATKIKPANQTIHFGPEMPSQIILPVLSTEK